MQRAFHHTKIGVVEGLRFAGEGDTFAVHYTARAYVSIEQASCSQSLILARTFCWKAKAVRAMTAGSTGPNGSFMAKAQLDTLVKKRSASGKGTRAASSARGGRRRAKPQAPPPLPPPALPHGRRLLLLTLEAVGMASIGGLAVVVMLGLFAERFSGTDMVNNLLPFAGGVLAVIFVAAGCSFLWYRLRRRLIRISPFLPAVLVVASGVAATMFIPQQLLQRTFVSYRTLVGGREEAARVTLAHQVYAAYRRHDIGQLRKMVNRAGPYEEAIEHAAATFGLDIDLLKGLAATESSFLPRESGDGGQGLFQITRVPAAAVAVADKHFAPAERAVSEPRYNAFVGAATLRHYLTEMKNDLFLGLLAYNIGPANGGLRFIMNQYGATDFITIQPYLMQLPRDYPIRVLSYALAFRLAQVEGELLAYEEGKNAVKIQRIGIPGM
jgi:soluble lytic murein transglycosylase-like protein